MARVAVGVATARTSTVLPSATHHVITRRAHVAGVAVMFSSRADEGLRRAGHRVGGTRAYTGPHLPRFADRAGVARERVIPCSASTTIPATETRAVLVWSAETDGRCKLEVSVAVNKFREQDVSNTIATRGNATTDHHHARLLTPRPDASYGATLTRSRFYRTSCTRGCLPWSSTCPAGNGA